MIHRREFLAGIAAMMAVPHSLDAQQAGKMYRIGVLSLYDPSTFPQLMQAFREGMREAGYLEGRHYALEMRNAAGKPAELGAVARTLVAQSHRTRAVFDRYNIVDERDLRDAMVKTSAYVAALPREAKVVPLPTLEALRA